MSSNDARKEADRKRYKVEANKKYLKTVIRKQVVVSPKKDAELLAAIQADNTTVFCELVRALLRDYYGIKPK